MSKKRFFFSLFGEGRENEGTLYHSLLFFVVPVPPGDPSQTNRRDARVNLTPELS